MTNLAAAAMPTTATVPTPTAATTVARRPGDADGRDATPDGESTFADVLAAASRGAGTAGAADDDGRTGRPGPTPETSDAEEAPVDPVPTSAEPPPPSSRNVMADLLASVATTAAARPTARPGAPVPDGATGARPTRHDPVGPLVDAELAPSPGAPTTAPSPVSPAPASLSTASPTGPASFAGALTGDVRRDVPGGGPVTAGAPDGALDGAPDGGLIAATPVAAAQAADGARVPAPVVSSPPAARPVPTADVPVLAPTLQDAGATASTPVPAAWAAAPLESARQADPAAPIGATTPADPGIARPAAVADRPSAPVEAGPPLARAVEVPTLPGAQVASAVAAMRRRGDGNYTASLELNPAELGSVLVDVEVRAGVVSVVLSPEQASTRSLLHSQLGDLRDALQQAGLEAGSLDVSSESRGGRRDADPDEPAHTAHRDGAAASERPVFLPSLSVTRQHRTGTSVDLRV